MSIEKALQSRSESKCELCSATDNLVVYIVPPHAGDNPDECILVCATCHAQIQAPDHIDVNHWRCLNDSMWSQVPAVQIMAYRMLNHLKNEDWAFKLLEMIYLDDATLTVAKSTIEDDENTEKHIDSNGAPLASGDTIVIIKDLNVKGTSFTAKRGTAVRGISLVADNHEHIEGVVNGQKIVILTKFVKKS